MFPLDLVNLPTLMERTQGSPAVRIALIDGPVVTEHTDLATDHLVAISGEKSASCIRTDSAACLHGTFVAGILSARRNSAAPAICPDCTLLIRSIFTETNSASEHMPSATPLELAKAIVETIDAGAHLINLSVALSAYSSRGKQELVDSLNYAASHGVIVVAAAGNQRLVGGSTITGHSWVIPVAACDSQGKPVKDSNLGNSIGRRGLSAPGQDITSLGTNGSPARLAGTSAAAPFVTGTAALLWSLFPKASPSRVKLALTNGSGPRRKTVVPPLLDAWGAYQAMQGA